MLTLAEELLLLALDDEEGSVTRSASASLDYGLAGAMLVELTLQGRLGMEGENFVLLDASPTGDILLDRVIYRVQSARKNRDPQHWVSQIGSGSIRSALTDRLVEKGILEREARHVLWVIPYRRYPTRDAGPERDVRERVRAVVLDGAEPQPRDAAILSLIKSCNLVDEVFLPEERKRAHERLEEISADELIGKSVSGAVAQAQAATQAAVTGAVVATTISAAASCSAGASSC